jgi:hypothetical protein
LEGAELKVAWLVPVCLFGFGLCPYLDLTFHRARQGVDSRGAKVAFGAGFGVFFFSMILFTLMYSGVMTERLEGEMIGLAGVIVGVHMVVQAGYTIAAHLREVMPVGDGEGKRLAGFLLGAAGVLGGVWWLTAGRARVGEVPYLMFMGFYGLVFPAYVWAALMGRGKVNWRVLAGGIALAGPCYYVGFVGREMVWLLPGLVIALVAGVVSGKVVGRRAVAG